MGLPASLYGHWPFCMSPVGKGACKLCPFVLGSFVPSPLWVWARDRSLPSVCIANGCPALQLALSLSYCLFDEEMFSNFHKVQFAELLLQLLLVLEKTEFWTSSEKGSLLQVGLVKPRHKRVRKFWFCSYFCVLLTCFPPAIWCPEIRRVGSGVNYSFTAYPFIHLFIDWDVGAKHCVKN